MVRPTEHPPAAGCNRGSEYRNVLGHPGVSGHPGPDAPWSLTIGPSNRLTAAIAGGHGMAAAAVLAAPMPAAAMLLLCGLLLASAAMQLARTARVSRPGSITGLELDAIGRVRLRRRAGSELAGWLLPSTVVGRRLTLVRLRLDGHCFPVSVPLVADNCDPEALRRLRVGLAWQAGPALRQQPRSGGLN